MWYNKKKGASFWRGVHMSDQTLLQMLEESRYTTVLSGAGMLLESGYPAIRDGAEAYEMEQKYGHAPEEIFRGSFYSTRTEQFFEFYKDVMLGAIDTPPGKCFYEMAELERRGLFQMIITRRVFGLPERAGCRNVINLHGSIYNNHCPHCGKKYSVDYIRNAKRVPLCEDCNTVIRPDVCLYGEMVSNQLITRAAEEVAKADVLLVLGANLKSYLCSHLLPYYHGEKLIVINSEPHFSDKYADMVIRRRVDDTLEQIRKELEN